MLIIYFLLCHPVEVNMASALRTSCVKMQLAFWLFYGRTPTAKEPLGSTECSQTPVSSAKSFPFVPLTLFVKKTKNKKLLSNHSQTKKELNRAVTIFSHCFTINKSNFDSLVRLVSCRTHTHTHTTSEARTCACMSASLITQVTQPDAPSLWQWQWLKAVKYSFQSDTHMPHV